MSLRAIPCLRVFVPFALGLVVGSHVDTPIAGLGYALLSGAVILCILALLKYPFRYRWIFGTFFQVLLFVTGFYHVTRHDERLQAGHFSPNIQNCHYWTGIVYDAPGKGARIKVPLRVESMGAAPDAMLPAAGNILLLVDISPATQNLRYGDRIGVRVTVRPSEPPKNPHAFDYRRYLHFQNIHFQAFVKSDSLVLLSTGHGHPVWRAAYSCREKLLAMLQQHFPTQAEYAVASALLVGYKEDLPDDLRTAYAETGSMHALAVSGTHVGLVYAGLFFLLSRLRLRGRWGRLVQNATLLSAIWAFALLTGASASVLRATVMFSTYLLGKAMFRSASVWNVLGGSAIGLLLYNPYFLFDAGFQLSYAAVAGMVFFYPRFYRLSPVLPGWADKAWQALLIGFAAQIGTLPLSLYYFHQFPVYFWLAGWVVVFGGAVFMAGGAVLVLLDFFLPAFAHWLGLGLYWMLWVINQLIIGIQHLPFSVIGGIWIAGWAAVLLYLFIALLGATLAQRKAKWLLGALGVLSVLGICRAVRDVRQMGQEQVAVYCVTRNSLVDFIYGQSTLALSDSISNRQVMFSAQSNRWAAGVREVVSIHADTDTIFCRSRLWYDPPFVQFSDKKMAFIHDARLAAATAAPPVAVDVLVLSHSPRVTIAACRERFPFGMVVFDASNSWKQTTRWKAECTASGIPFYDVREQGAWVYAK